MNNKKNLHLSATEVSSGVSDQYAPVSTEILLSPFHNRGWETHSKIESGGKFGKELLTLRHPEYKMPNGDALEVICSNSFDGTSALILMGGYGRLVCTNGLVVGDLDMGRFVHRGTAIYDRIEDQYEKIVAKLDTLKDRVQKLESIDLNDDQVNNVIKNIAQRVFGKDTKTKESNVVEINPYRLKGLKRPRRDADKGTDAFTRLNVVQENIIRNGLLTAKVETIDKETGEKTVQTTTKNRTEDKISSIRLNQVIFEEFSKLAA